MSDLCFTLPDPTLVNDANRGKGYYQAHILTLSQRCWSHYEKPRSVQKGRGTIKETLYTGSLGPCCYMRYRMATSPTFHGDNHSKYQMLMDALSSANAVLLSDTLLRGAQQFTLLNSELVGALTMKIVIGNAALRLMIEENNVNTGDIDALTLKREIESCLNQLLEVADTYILSSCLPSSECGVFHGRSGYLKAIKFVQEELSDANFGKAVARKVLAQIWEEANDVGRGNILLWKWKQKIHLGALNGISGVLHTLLDFEEDLSSINPDAFSIIESTVMKMNDYCLKSGNLAGTLKSALPTAPPKTVDKHVQFCSGSPGHALLLLQMHRKSRNREKSFHATNMANDSRSNTPSSKQLRVVTPQGSFNESSKNYLLQAQHIAESVILPRGLLKKGVCLCHGISGNAFIFLSIHNAMAMSKDNDISDEEESKHWLQCAYTYANFALDHLEELENTQDRPYSLYEGLAGLVCFLLGLVEGTSGVNAKFPCFEF